MRQIYFALALLLLASVHSGGCVRALQQPAEDHYVQTKTLAEWCRADGYQNSYPESPCSEYLQEDLDKMAEQARCIVAISRGVECGEVD